LSDSAISVLTATLVEARGPIADRAHTHARQMEAQATELQEAIRRLEIAPPEEALQDEFEQVVATRTMTMEVERLNAENKKARAVAEMLLNRHRRSVELIRSRLEENKSLADRLQRAVECRRALVTYQRLLTERKTKLFEQRVTARFQSLARKNDLVRQIRIDPTTFDVHLIDEHEREIPRSELSAGEKQVYAVSLLWGLADTSGRPLPMLIDTPLGRLDSDHRANLVKNYFPHVSHQVIILSTDTEVDEALFDQLSPHIERAFLLDSESGPGGTALQEGYFWRGEAA
jgi:DNA sulfur modification protein DndD